MTGIHTVHRICTRSSFIISLWSIDRITQSRLVYSLSRFVFWTSDNIRGTHHVVTFFIDKYSIKIERTLPVEVPTDVAMKPTDSYHSLQVCWPFQQVLHWWKLPIVTQWSPSYKFSMPLCNCRVSRTRPTKIRFHLGPWLRCRNWLNLWFRPGFGNGEKPPSCNFGFGRNLPARRP